MSDIEAVVWVSTVQAAKLIGNVTPRTLYRMIDGGEIPAHRFGRVIRLKKEDIEAFVLASLIPLGGLGNSGVQGAEEVLEENGAR